MQFKEYPSYKNSGVEWLGDVPSDWHVKRFGYIFSENKTKNRGLIENNVLSLSYGNIKEKNVEDNKGLLPESFETYQLIEPNDIIFRFTDLQNDKRSLRSAISNYKGIITSAYISVRTRQNAEYFNYLFRAYDLQKVYYSMGDGMRQSLKIDELNRMPITVPNQQIQTQIANYLDQETQKIDTLIAKQEKLIELLEEQRKSVISHAVTKGLDSNAPMKDSGVEWLGDVPSHWKVTFIKYITNKISSGKTPLGGAEVYTNHGVIFLRSQNIYNDGLRLDDVSFIPSEIHISMKSSTVKKNDVLLNITGGSIGRTCLVDRDIGDANVNQHVCIIRASKEKYSKWIAMFMKSNSAQAQISYSQTGAGREGLNFSQIANMRLPFPKVEEQEHILNFVSQENIKYDNLISKQQALIEKFKEYRASIISHAVTGKIDVRELVA